jgi:demethylmenaquinone methyltransferase/2-methoxy-6-polyprenyl-1,4-benzoquinol methylase
MITNKNHWYDGIFYEKFIAPNQDKMFTEIKSLMSPDSTIIDVGCGTGRFSFSVADYCKSVLGIDLSKRNIERAKIRLARNYNDRISFVHGSLSSISSTNENHWDYSVITFVLHEMNEEHRLRILNELSQLTDNIIIGDYLANGSLLITKIFNELVELFAGFEHYRNYKNYIRNGGLNYLVEKAGLKIINEIKDKVAGKHLVVLKKV